MYIKQNRLNAGAVLGFLLHGVKDKALLMLAITAFVMPAPVLRADPLGRPIEHNTIEGTWMTKAEPGAPPSLLSFLSGGHLIYTRTITVVPSGPETFELVGTGHGEWIQTGRHEFASTMFLVRSNPSTDFTGIVKVVSTFTYDGRSDHLTSAGTVYIYDADNVLLFSFPAPGSGVYYRVTAGR